MYDFVYFCDVPPEVKRFHLLADDAECVHYLLEYIIIFHSSPGYEAESSFADCFSINPEQIR